MPSNKETRENRETALVVADDSEQLRCVIPFNRQYYVFDDRTVENGGNVVSSVKSCLQISASDYAGLRDSTSDTKWSKFLRPTNILLLKLQEGTFPYAFFDVEGHPNAKYLSNPIPIEVSQKIFPKLLSDVLANPERFGIKVTGVVEDSKLKKSKARIDALRWTPEMCKSANNKGKVLKSCRPNPQMNGLEPTSVNQKRAFDEMLRLIIPRVIKRKATPTPSAVKETNSTPPGVTFKKDVLPGIVWDMGVELNGASAKLETVGDLCFLRIYKRARSATDDAVAPADDEVAPADDEVVGDEAADEEEEEER